MYDMMDWHNAYIKPKYTCSWLPFIICTHILSTKHTHLELSSVGRCLCFLSVFLETCNKHSLQTIQHFQGLCSCTIDTEHLQNGKKKELEHIGEAEEQETEWTPSSVCEHWRKKAHTASTRKRRKVFKAYLWKVINRRWLTCQVGS